MAANEIFPIVTPEGVVTGSATRAECHSGSKLLHPVVHLHILSRDGRVYIQKRSMSKDIQPGKWDTAVGGHVDYGEETETALFRETREELGLTDFVPTAVTRYVFESAVEKELVNVFATVVDDGFSADFDPVEIDDARFWSIAEIENAVGKGILTPNFEQEFSRIKNELKGLL